MVDTNNNVEEYREEYENHALHFLTTMFPDKRVELAGHSKPGKSVKDIRIHATNGDVTKIEVKGSLLIDADKKNPQWQRVKLRDIDYAGTNMADVFLFIFNTEQLGFNPSICSYCNKPSCTYLYRLMTLDQVLNMVKYPDKKFARISPLTIFKEIRK